MAGTTGTVVPTHLARVNRLQCTTKALQNTFHSLLTMAWFAVRPIVPGHLRKKQATS